MRTTLTLDDDLALALRHLCEERRIGWKQAVNEVVRRGLAAPSGPAGRRERYRTVPQDSGRLLMPPDLVSTDDMLDWAEGEDRE